MRMPSYQDAIVDFDVVFAVVLPSGRPFRAWKKN
jgi:hypothetical protein